MTDGTRPAGRLTTAKTTAERQRAYKARQRAAGMKELRNLWSHPDDEAGIRAHAKQLATRRARRLAAQGAG